MIKRDYIMLVIFIITLFISGCAKGSNLEDIQKNEYVYAVVDIIEFSETEVKLNIDIKGNNDIEKIILYIDDNTQYEEVYNGSNQITFNGDFSNVDQFQIKFTDNLDIPVFYNQLNNIALFDSLTIDENIKLDLIEKENKHIKIAEVKSVNKISNIDHVVESTINIKQTYGSNSTKMYFRYEGDKDYVYYYEDYLGQEVFFKTPYNLEHMNKDKNNLDYTTIISNILHNFKPIELLSEDDYILKYKVSLSDILSNQLLLDLSVAYYSVNNTSGDILVDIVFDKDTGFINLIEFDFEDIKDQAGGIFSTLLVDKLKYTIEFKDIDKTYVEFEPSNYKYKVDNEFLDIRNNYEFIIDDHMEINDTVDFYGDYKIYAFNDSKGTGEIIFNTDNPNIKALYIDDFNQHAPRHLNSNSNYSVKNMDQTNSFYYIYVYCDDVVGGSYSLDIEYHNSYNDDYPDNISEEASEIPIDKYINAHSYTNYEYDVFKISVEETGTYRVEVEDLWLDSNFNRFIYDSSGNLVGEGDTQELTKGEYYIMVKLQDHGDYRIKIHHLVDDNPLPTELNLNEGLNEHSVYYDYLGDTESFTFTIEEETMIYFKLDKGDFNFYDENGELISKGYNEWIFEYNFAPGTYTIEIIGNYEDEYLTLSSYIDSTYFDYSNNYTVDGTNYGVLNFGLNDVELLTNFDSDIYEVDIVIDDTFILVYSYPSMKAYYVNGENDYQLVKPGEIMDLDLGKHYFKFEISESSSVYSVEFKVNPDKNIESNMEQYTINMTKSTELTYTEDIDYFTFSVNGTKTYEITSTGRYYLSITLEDSNGNVIFAVIPEKKFIFTLSEGDYVIKVMCFGAEIINSHTVSFNLTEYTETDDAPNSLFLPYDEYQTIGMGPKNILQGEINYQYDQDVYLINIKEDGEYRIYFKGQYTSYYCYKENGESIECSDKYYTFLNSGIYYVRIVNGTESYSIGYIKNPS